MTEDKIKACFILSAMLALVLGGVWGWSHPFPGRDPEMSEVFFMAALFALGWVIFCVVAVAVVWSVATLLSKEAD